MNNFLKNNTKLHYIICLLGLTAIISGIARKAGAIIDSSFSMNIAYSDSALLVADHTKISSLLQYITLIATLFISLVFIAKYRHSDSVSIFLNTLNLKFSKIIYFSLLAILNLYIFKLLFFKASIKLLLIFFCSCLWLFCFLVPFYSTYSKFLSGITKKTLLSLQKASYILLSLIMLQLIVLFLPYIGNASIKIANDYFGIPEKTIIDGRTVQNFDYIKSHNIGGLYGKIDDKTTIPNITDALPNLTQLYCKKVSQATCFYLKDRLNNNRVSNYYSNSELSFIKKNLYELNGQLIAGHYFHHQNALIGPLNAYKLHENIKKIIFLYGFGNTILLTKLMSCFGGFNFQTLTHVLFSFYPIYYFLLLGISWFIFRNVFFVLFIMLSSLSALQFLGFETIRYAPGNDPLRHLMDLLVIASFFQYTRSKNFNWLYLIASFGFSLLAVWMDKEFGIIIFIALTLAFFIQLFFTKQKILPLVIFLAASVIAIKIDLVLKTLGSDPLAIYGILGVSVAPTSHLTDLLIFFTIILLYGLFYITYSNHKKNSFFFLAWFLFFYYQGMMIYFVWYTNSSHFLSACAIPLILLFTIFIKELSSRDKSESIYKIFLCMTCGTLIFIYLPSLFFYKLAQQRYNDIFKTHVVYQWTFPRAKFLSTMNPKPFENAISLINKYDKGPSVYMISRYDNFLPFLSDKYTAWPYEQLSLSIVSQKEFNNIISIINTKKPQFIFIDSDIKSDHFHDILGYNDPVELMFGPNHNGYNLSAGRVLALINLRDVFDAIKSSYHLIAKGDLIDVYRRNI